MSENITKPSILSGFMELLPKEQLLFNKMLDIIRKNYEKFGFTTIETPIIEKAEVLLAKGGGETDKEVYQFTKGKRELALRFDLTVPLARYVAQYFSDLDFPFRRYHISKVFRGERPQKGRFREFYQCDIDIVGNGELGLLNDAEIPAVIYATFKELDFGKFTIRINNRKLLNGFFESLEVDNKTDIMRIIDKLEKIGAESVKEELSNLNLTEEKINKILTFIAIEGTNEEKLSALKSLNIENNLFSQGLEELSYVTEKIYAFGVPASSLNIDLTIARGLDYYTGTIYETILNDYPELGSICSGGRYDNLAGYYTKQKLPGVGISIGLTRLFDQLLRIGILKAEENYLTKALIIPMGENEINYSIDILNKLREQNIKAQLYSENGKMKKKFSYADKLNIPYTIVIGEDEMKNNTLTIKEMLTGEQKTVSFEEALAIL